jgi:thymidylate synthase
MFKRYHSPSEAYLAILADVLDNPDSRSAPRGQGVREKFNYGFTITHPDVDPIKTLDEQRNKAIKSYTIKEMLAYESQSNKAEDFVAISKFWDSIKNPDGTVNSAYGYLIWGNESHGSDFETEVYQISPGLTGVRVVRRTPWAWCVQALRADKDTRQAVLRFSLPEHFWKGNKDMTCTLHGMFMIRDNKLNLTINMRSNDLMLGLVYDMPWFQLLMFKMKNELLDLYPELEVGSYTHFVHNIHIYDRDVQKVESMIGRNS